MASKFGNENTAKFTDKKTGKELKLNDVVAYYSNNVGLVWGKIIAFSDKMVKIKTQMGTEMNIIAEYRQSMDVTHIHKSSTLTIIHPTEDQTIGIGDKVAIPITTAAGKGYVDIGTVKRFDKGRILVNTDNTVQPIRKVTKYQAVRVKN